MSPIAAHNLVPTRSQFSSTTALQPTPLPKWLQELAEREACSNSMEYLAKHSHSFRYAARFLPSPLNTLVADIYAFCRFTDDLVDKADIQDCRELSARLDQWKNLAADAYDGKASGLSLLDNPIMEMSRRNIPFTYADELIEGVRMDLSSVRYATINHLELYTYRVASVVGLWLTELVGINDPKILKFASDLGHAMQLTNILRDVGEDASVGRVYIPMDKLLEYGILPESLSPIREGNLDQPQQWSNLIEEMMGIASKKYQSAFKGISALPVFFQRPVLISALVYQDIHTAIRKNGYNNLSKRAHTTKLRKIWLGIKSRFIMMEFKQPIKFQMPLPVTST